MPKVSPEYTPYATVKVDSGGATGPMRIDFPRVEFSNAVGQALSGLGSHGYGALSEATKALGHSYDKLGKAFEGAGDEIWKRAVGLMELENETAAKKGSLEYNKYLMNEKLEYDMKLGEAADPKVFKAKTDEWEAKRQELMARLPVGARRHFDDHSRGSFITMGQHAATHTASETKKVVIGTSNARITGMMDEFTSTKDLDRAGYLTEEIEKELRDTLGPAMGWNDTLVGEKWKEVQSTLVSNRLTYMGFRDPTSALKLLDSYRDSGILTGKTFLELDHKLKQHQQEIESRNIARDIHEANPDDTLEDNLERVRKRAMEIRKDNPLLVTEAERHYSAMHAKHHQEKEELIKRNTWTVMDGVWGYGAGGDQPKPETIEQLFALGEDYEKAFYALPSHKQHDILESLKKNGRRDFMENEGTRTRVNALMGAAQSTDIKYVREFLNTNLEDEKIPAAERNKLYALQRELRAQPLKRNETVAHAMKVLEPILPEKLRTWQSPESRKMFEGALYQAIKQAQQDKAPVKLDSDNILEIGNELLREYDRKWFGMSTTDIWEKMRDPSEGDIERIKEKYPGVTDDQVKDIFGYEFWKLRYEGLLSKGLPLRTPTSKPAVPAPPDASATPAVKGGSF